MIHPRTNRQGVVLLITLSILTLFALLAVTFVISSGVFKTAATTSARVGITGDPPENEIHQALMTVLRGPSLNASSSLVGHSVLEDLYGSDGFAAVVTGASTVGSSSQFVQVTFTVETGFTAKPTKGFYNGSVITMVSGPASMSSARIVDYTSGTIICESFQFASGGVSLPVAGDRLIVNGKPFNGTGAGYNTANGLMDLAFNGNSVAFLPNYSRYAAGAYSAGGLDESWDAADYQNMWLAAVQPGHTTSNQIIPSFHRPSLVNYFYDDVVGGTVDPRHFVLRPTQLDHPNFTGSNPYMSFSASALQANIQPLLDALIQGPWDVDNDGNGVNDSIWVDMGFPVKTSPDGRSYKPLFAVLIKDLDSRLDLNAHGNLAQTVGTYGNAVAGPYSTPANVTWGSGYGPADVYLGHPAIGFTTPNQLYTGNGSVAGRYGADGVPGVAGPDMLSNIKEWGLPPTYGQLAGTSLGFGSPPNTFGRNPFAIDFIGQPAYQFVAETSASDDPYELNLFQPTHNSQVDQPFNVSELERLLRYYDGDASTLSNRLLELELSFTGNTTTEERMRDLVTTVSRHIPTPNSTPPQYLRGTGGSDVAVSIADIVKARLTAGGFAGSVDGEVQKMLAFELLHGEMMDINRWLGNGFDDNNNGVVDEPMEAETSGFRGPPSAPAYAPPNSFTSSTFNRSNGSSVSPLYGASSSTTFPVDTRQIFARHLYCLMMALIDGGYLHPVAETQVTADPVLHKEMLARRVAQWAINVVDFRDADAIMTPFEYDVDPFDDDGWSVDGNLHTFAPTEADARVVWGTENPDLIITESLATHDRRVRDTVYDSGSSETRWHSTDKTKEGDDDLDQYRIPQGSLFIELFCPRSIAPYNNPHVPADLYDPTTRQLNLEAVDANGNPVWRILITEGSQDAEGNTSVKSPDMRLATRYESTRIDPFDMNYDDRTLPTAADVLVNPTLDANTDPGAAVRVIWFSRNAPNATVNPYADRTYFNRGAPGSANMTPGQYAIVGPRQTTYFGSRRTSPETASPQGIQLNPASIVRTDLGGTSVSNPQGKGIVVAAQPPAGWSNTGVTANLGPDYGTGIGISVSEPLPSSTLYYNEPIGNSLIGTFDAYDEFDPASGAATNSSLPDEPFDDDDSAGMPLRGVTATRTIAKFRTSFLQRVANPGLPWNPLPGQPMYDNTRPVNPYITVDWSSIDLSVYNGEDRLPADWNDDLADGKGTGDDRLVKKEGSGPNDPEQAIGPWDPGDVTASDDDPATPTIGFRAREAGSATGAYNPYAKNFGNPSPTALGAGTDLYFNYQLQSTLGGLNSMFTLLTPANASYPQAPATPFISLAWQDRPYYNPMELLCVPASGPTRLTTDITPLDVTNNPYTTPATVLSYNAPHRHLFNFYAGEFAQLFDYVDVRSPFSGAELWYNPSASVTGFAAPYNRLSRFRDPGRVNINTVLDIGQLNAMLNDNTGTLATQLINSRRGYAGAGWNALDTNGDYPSRFGQPFRSATSGTLMPPTKAGTDANTSKLLATPINATLMRGFSTGGNVARPILADVTATAAATDGTDHAHFFYNRYKSTGSIFTTHSNVFAVWITVGYFEVEPNPGGFDAAHPDGYRLSRELGSDYGDVQRHRGFYIIDRSVPVALEPGQDHNVNKTILLQRMIE